MAADIAVVIPAWDLGQELVEAVNSVANQDSAARILVIDNASHTPLPPLPHVEVIRLPQRVSVGAARNAGLAHVSEEFVMFMEGDDLLTPGALRFLASQISQRPEVTIVAGRFRVWDPNTGRSVPARWPFEYCYRLNKFPWLFALINCVRNVLPTTGPVLARTEAVRESGGFADSNWAEDWALGAVLGFVGIPLLSRRCCGLYRVDVNRVTLSDYKERRFRPAWQGRMQIRQKLRTSPVVPRYVRWAAPLLVVPHAYFAVIDVLVARQQVANVSDEDALSSVVTARPD